MDWALVIAYNVFTVVSAFLYNRLELDYTLWRKDTWITVGTTFVIFGLAVMVIIRFATFVDFLLAL